MALLNHLVDHLLQTSDFLVQQAPQSNLGKAYRRRAISTAYYAVFHAIAYVVADVVIGWSSENALLEPIFRSLDHKVTKSRLLSSPDPELRAVGAIFARLQEKRNDADYMPPAHNPGRAEAMDAIEQARQAVQLIESLSVGQRRSLTVSIVAKPR